MPAGQRPPDGSRWLPYAGFALALAGIIYQGGVLSNRVEQHTQDIAQLKVSDRLRADALEQMNLRGERSAAKLDFLVQQARDTEDHRK